MNQEGMRRIVRRRAQRHDRRPESGLLGAVFQAFAREAAELGLRLPEATLEAASRSRRRDPVTGDESLVCDWRDEWGQPVGTLVINPDGSFYAEQALIQRRPGEGRPTAGSIRAWGVGGGAEVRSEVRWVPV